MTDDSALRSDTRLYRRVDLDTIVLGVWVVLWAIPALGAEPLWVRLAAAVVALMMPAMAWYFK